MTLIGLGSLKGSPGVTTLALGLAARWPSGEQPVVVECDPAGGDLLARFRLETSPGLVSLASAARRGVEPGLVWQHTQRLPGGLPVVAGPAGAGQARAALAQLGSMEANVFRRAGDRAGTVVLADFGRLDPDTPGAGIVRAADVMLLLARARDDDLSHVAIQLASGAAWTPRTCFVLVGDGYATAEVEDALGIEVLGRIPQDSQGAAALSGTAGRRSAPARSALLRAVEPVVAAAAERARALSGPPRQLAGDSGVVADPGGVPQAGQGDPRVLWSGARR